MWVPAVTLSVIMIGFNLLADGLRDAFDPKMKSDCYGKVLEVKNLEISFDTFAGKVQAIRDVSFELYKGETLAIVGESGSGKSVTTRSIMGLLASNANIDNGEILFNGTDILKKSEKELQKIRGKEIAMIFQDPMTSLDPTMPIANKWPNL